MQRGKENMKFGGLDKKGLSIVDKPLNTQKEISEDLGWSTGKVATITKYNNFNLLTN